MFPSYLITSLNHIWKNKRGIKVNYEHDFSNRNGKKNMEMFEIAVKLDGRHHSFPTFLQWTNEFLMKEVRASAILRTGFQKPALQHRAEMG